MISRSLLACCLAVWAPVSMSAPGIPISVPAPSFDCAKAKGYVETTICSGENRLAEPDGKISWIYQRLLLHTGADQKEAIRQEQRNWLLKRNACTELSCLEAILDARETALRSALERADRALRAHVEQTGQCENTRIDFMGTRLEPKSHFDPDEPDERAGTTLGYADGVWQVSYDQDPPVLRSRLGDPVRVCLTSIPRGCPKGDDRGRKYSVENLRTHARWKYMDAEHGCGGA